MLAVEGEDERQFFDGLLRHIGIPDVQIECVGGKNQFAAKLPALLNTPGFFDAGGRSLVTHLGVVRDKDEDHAFLSIASIVTKLKLAAPDRHGDFSRGSPSVGIFIMPGEHITGTMLEDLCLEAVKTHSVMPCVEQFMGCIEPLSNCPSVRSSKAKCQVFLAAQNEIVNCVGLGAQKGYWNFDSSALLELRAFLMQMR
ncbi:MAG: hypothetical protein JW955_14445 [Sedimentisphaerales bacterium]|nr:hypothetical protein [Sedimentisphaerales bacterium]